LFAKPLAFVALIGIAALAACAPAAVPTLSAPTAIAEPPETAAAGSAAPKQWSQPPAMSIDPSTVYLATFKTVKGDIRVQLFADLTPITVNNFIFLARQGYYDGTTFHRVLQDFMAQGGDPTGSGSGGPGYQFGDEIVANLQFDGEGYLAMANSGPGTNGSQFFITTAATPWLNGKHTIFGKVVSGMEVVRVLTLRDPETSPAFAGDALNTVVIEESAASLLPTPAPPKAPEPAAGRPLAQLAVVERADLYDAPPENALDFAKTYTATLATSKGEIVIVLNQADAPQSVNNFVVLANLGYWDDFPVNFVEPSGQFVLTGSPAGQPNSGVGYALPGEPKSQALAGAVGYYPDPSGFGVSGSQFFILLQDNPDMTGQYTFFGTVVAGLEVAGQLTTADTIETITITAR
jgi:peptidyl-prolyl cis-trans isomerase B (cyclophilin B)